MSSSINPSPRRLMHRRSFDVQVFAREDDLFDVEARIIDTKTRDMTVGGLTRPAGAHLHEMLLQLVIDRHLTIVAAGSETQAMPYPGQCNQHGDAYAQLVGLNLMRGFRAEVKARLSGIRGCTHLTEMCSILPTAVLQALAGEVIAIYEGSSSPENEQAPYQIDRCHALRSDGPVVQHHYPRWYRKPAVPTSAS